jgi:hypothetical protein
VTGGGGKLKLTIRTSPDAGIIITLQVKQHKKVLYRKKKTGRADHRGRWSTSLKVTFNPGKATKATLTIEADTGGGSATYATSVTILPHG